MFKLIKKEAKQLVKSVNPKHEVMNIKDAAVSNREEINKLREEIEAINRTIESEKKKNFNKDIVNKILLTINFALASIILYLLLKT